MKPAARIERNCFVLNQLFHGYGGYIYEVVYAYTNSVWWLFSFKGEEWPADENSFELVRDFNDGIYWLKNFSNDKMLGYERWLQMNKKQKNGRTETYRGIGK